MNYLNIKGISLKAITMDFPEAIVNNQDNSNGSDKHVQKVIETIGIESRYVCGDETTSLDLMFNATRKLLANENITIDDIDVLVCVTQTPDYIIPGNSFVLCNKLNAKANIFTLDINAGCSGFTHGLITISKLMENSSMKNGILVLGDAISKHVNAKDMSIQPIFGDGAAACLFNNDKQSAGFLTSWGTIASGYDKIMIKAGGARTPSTTETGVTKRAEDDNYRSEDDLFMSGADVFSFTIKEVPMMVDKMLTLAGQTVNDIDYFVFHQANKFIVEYIQKKVKIPSSKLILNMDTIGNTGSASIPNAICLEAQRSKRDKFSGLFCFTGFGAGLSISSAICEIDNLSVYA